VALLPPYNEHLLRDFGALNLAMVVVLPPAELPARGRDRPDDPADRDHGDPGCPADPGLAPATATARLSLPLSARASAHVL
jgi:hypothetical protein